MGDRVLFGCHDYVVKLLAGCPALEDLVLESTYNDACGGVVCAEGNFELSLKHLTRAKIGFSWKERCLKSMLLIFQALSHVRCLSLSPCTVAVRRFSTLPLFKYYTSCVYLCVYGSICSFNSRFILSLIVSCIREQDVALNLVFLWDCCGNYERVNGSL